jgi:uncharacterized membrane protein
MSDSTPGPGIPVAAPDSDQRTLAIVVYGLYLGALVTSGLAGLAGVILAYIKRDEAKGTIWYSHFENAIQAFWIWLGLCIVGALTFWFFFIGFVIAGIGFVYFLYRTVKGLIAAIDSRPYV